ncbi:hypothetical protein SBRCBS47491_009753 [Sporothrix bragantina]|uniref:LysM domain-containing protein n=1 Tax=Sporothrix bragantina TaxID=671064 RepID=A0ABP0CXB1_9PEZI
MTRSAIALLFTAFVGAVAVPVTEATPPTATPHCYLHVKARAGDSCAGIAAVFNIDTSLFRRMNPGVTEAGCGHLAAGTSYCVADGTYGSSTSSPSPAPSPPKSQPQPTKPSPSPPPAPPSPRQSPITDDCRAYYLVQHGETCGMLEDRAGISDATFRKWNGFINADCSNLWAGYYCCLGV